MLERLKGQVCAANLDLVKHKLIVMTWGNVSAIDRESGRIVIKPSGVSYDTMKPEDMVVVDLDGKPVADGLRPSSDTPTHVALYKAWPEIGGICHTHSIHATAFAQACRGIPCYGTTHADHFAGPVPVTRPLTQSEVDGDYEANTGVVILERFSGLVPTAMPGVLVANHGPFTWGPDAHGSVKNAIALEAIARMALQTLALRPHMQPVEQYLRDRHFHRKHGPGATYGQEGNDS